MNSEALLYVLALQHIPNLGDSTAKKLIRHLGSRKLFSERRSKIC